MLFYASFDFGFLVVVGIIMVICLVCYVVRKKFQIGTYTKEEEQQMKSNLDLLLKEEDKEEGKNYEDEV